MDENNVTHPNSIGSLEIEIRPKKKYARPQVLHELELETQAGSPLSDPDPFNWLWPEN